MVSKDELIESIWCGKNVFDATILSRIRSLRKALGDGGANQWLIKTVRGHGYRFIADVEVRHSMGCDVESASHLSSITHENAADKVYGTVGSENSGAISSHHEKYIPGSGKPSIAVLPFA